MTPEELKKNHDEVADKCDRDIILYGCAAILKNDDGTYTHIPAERLRFHSDTKFSVVKPIPFYHIE